MKFVLPLALICLALPSCKKPRPNYNISVFTGEKVPLDAPVISTPRTDNFYVYSSSDLIGTFSAEPTETTDYKYSWCMLGGNLIQDELNGLNKYTLRSGAIQFMRYDKKARKEVEVGRITSDMIVWYRQP
jgi:hypothetical protein